jgi:hypothetical protein
MKAFAESAGPPDANPQYFPVDPQAKRGFDGAQWILEGVKDQKYHVVDRWTPRDGAFREACLYLLKLSQIGISPKEVY